MCRPLPKFSHSRWRPSRVDYEVWSEANSNSCFWHTCICRPRRLWFPSNFAVNFGVRVKGLSYGIICVILHLAVLIQYRSVDRHTHTDRHTTTAYIALSKALHGKNVNLLVWCRQCQGCLSHRIIGGDIKEDWGSGDPSGVQGQSPSRVSGGQSHPEAQASLWN